MALYYYINDDDHVVDMRVFNEGDSEVFSPAQQALMHRETIDQKTTVAVKVGGQ